MSVAFLLTTLVVVATPGTGAVYTISAGLSRGRRASIVAAFGCTLGVLPHMVTAITGLAALLNASATAFQTIKWLGVAYLLYLAWQTWRDKSELTVADSPAPASSPRVIGTAVLINLLNPKLTIFFFAFLPQFVPAGTPDGWLQMTWLSLVFMAVTFVGLRAVRQLRRHDAPPGTGPAPCRDRHAPHLRRHLRPAGRPSRRHQQHLTWGARQASRRVQQIRPDRGATVGAAGLPDCPP